MSDEPIHSTSRSNGTTTILLDAIPDGSVCVAVEGDDGPLRQVAHWGDRETVFWLINELYAVLRAMDRQDAGRTAAIDQEAA